jgi:hypothetical protein
MTPTTVDVTVAHDDRPAEDGRIPAEPRRPHALADHGVRDRLPQILVGQRAADPRGNAHRPEEVADDDRGLVFRRIALTGEDHREADGAADRGERTRERSRQSATSGTESRPSVISWAGLTRYARTSRSGSA